MDLDLRAYVRVLRKRKWLIALVFVLCIGAGAFYTARQTPKYEAVATLFVGQPQITVQQLPQSVAVTNLSNQLLKSYAEILTSRSTAGSRSRSAPSAAVSARSRSSGRSSSSSRTSVEIRRSRNRS
jgi:uncharacterized protein involved in exopolysaccharide biosynthesis